MNMSRQYGMKVFKIHIIILISNSKGITQRDKILTDRIML